jgi:hypothetical protein
MADSVTKLTAHCKFCAQVGGGRDSRQLGRQRQLVSSASGLPRHGADTSALGSWLLCHVSLIRQLLH